MVDTPSSSSLVILLDSMENLNQKYPHSARDFDELVEEGHTSLVQEDMTACRVPKDFVESTVFEPLFSSAMSRVPTEYTFELWIREEGHIVCAQCERKGIVCERQSTSTKAIRCTPCKTGSGRERCSRVPAYKLWFVKQIFGMSDGLARKFLDWEDNYRLHYEAVQNDDVLTWFKPKSEESEESSFPLSPIRKRSAQDSPKFSAPRRSKRQRNSPPRSRVRVLKIDSSPSRVSSEKIENSSLPGIGFPSRQEGPSQCASSEDRRSTSRFPPSRSNLLTINLTPSEYASGEAERIRLTEEVKALRTSRDSYRSQLLDVLRQLEDIEKEELDLIEQKAQADAARRNAEIRVEQLEAALAAEEAKARQKKRKMASLMKQLLELAEQ